MERHHLVRLDLGLFVAKICDDLHAEAHPGLRLEDNYRVLVPCSYLAGVYSCNLHLVVEAMRPRRVRLGSVYRGHLRADQSHV